MTDKEKLKKASEILAKLLKDNNKVEEKWARLQALGSVQSRRKGVAR